MKQSNIVVVLLFAMSFALIGWTAPVLYATHAPNDRFIEVHNFEAQDTTVANDRHYICFDRTVYQPTPATIYMELYLTNGDRRTQLEVDSDRMSRYFQEGKHRVVTPVELPQNVKPGEYRYLLVAQLELADGRIERSFVYESDVFVVRNESTPVTRTWAC